MESQATSRRQGERSLVFISRQQLLADTLGRLLAREGGWSVSVLDADDPALLHDAAMAAPAVVVIDVDTRLLPGLELLSHLRARLPSAGMLVLGELTGAATAEAISRGARGCLTYAASLEDVSEAVESAACGRTSVAPSALRGLLGTGRRHLRCADPVGENQLSPRELDVLRLLADGRSTRAIADEFGISVETVRKHGQHILSKLGVHSKLQAVAVALRRGLL